MTLTPEQIAFVFDPKVTAEVRERFMEFHRMNPRVYSLLKRFALEAKAAGQKKYSIYAIYNRARWHVYIETRGSEEFKLNNNYQPYYARLLMIQEADLADFFETRTAKADSELEVVRA